MNPIPAFPVPIHKSDFDTTPDDFRDTNCLGMTLRDYFAAHALQGMCAHDELATETYERLANYSYQQADAMLKEREK